MKKSLKVLLNALDKIDEDAPEIMDTEVRERIRVAVENALLRPVAGYELPDEFGMFSPEAEKQVRAALVKFIEAARVESAGLVTFAERLRAFQDGEVESRNGNDYDEYFGYDDSLGEE